MNLLINKLVQFLVFGSTHFFAAGAVAEPAAATPTATSTPSEPAAPSTPATPSEPAAPANLSDIVKNAVTNAEKALAKPGVPAEVGEVPKAAEPAKPAAETTTEPAKPAEATTPQNPLDKLGPLPAEKIAAAFKDAPQAVVDWAKEKGLSLDALSENARLAAQASQFTDLFPGGLESANEAVDGAKNYWKIDSGLAEVKDLDSFDKFMAGLAELTFVRDDKGQPIPDPNVPGAFQNNGAIAKMVDFSAAARDSQILRMADQLAAKDASEDDKNYYTDLKGAVEFLGQFIGAGYKKPGPATDVAALPDDVKAKLAKADALEKQISERDTQQSAKDFDAQEDSIISETHKQIAPMIAEALSNTALSDELKTSIGKMVWDQVIDNMGKNELYARQRDTLSRRTQDYNARRVAININYMKPVAAKALAAIVGQIGAPMVDANKQRLDKLDAQSNAAKMEPRTSGTTVQSSSGVMSAEDIGKKALENARKTNPNAQPGSREYFAEVAKLKKLPIAG